MPKKKIRLFISAISLIVSCITTDVTAQQYLNLSFEQVDESKEPEKWVVISASNCSIAADTEISYSGKNSLLLYPTHGRGNFTALLLNELQQQLFKRKKKITIIAYAKFKDPSNSNLNILCKELSASGVEVGTPATSTTKTSINNKWRRYELQQEIDSAAAFMAFGVTASGTDSIWVDHFEIAIDNVPVIDNPKPKVLLPTSEEITWLNKNLVPLKIESLNSSDNDVVSQFLSNENIIALGEVSHGSSEIYKLKYNLCRLLFEKMQFSILAMEMDMSEAMKLNKYIIEGVGDPVNLLLETSYWPWKTKEFLELITWMRQYNKEHSKKIQLIGFDFSIYGSALDQIYNFALKHDPDLTDRLDQAKNLFAATISNQADDSIKKNLLSSTNQLQAYFQHKYKDYSKTCSSDELDFMSQSLVNFKYAVLYNLNKSDPDLFRDQCMAKNLDWIINNNSSKKVIVWAHNSHLKKDDQSMAGIIGKSHDLFSIGFALGEGYCNAVDETGTSISISDLTSPPQNSYERYFSETKDSSWFLKISNVSSQRGAAWLSQTHDFRYVGTKLPRYQFTTINLIKNFDAIIFIKTSTPSHLLFKK